MWVLSGVVLLHPGKSCFEEREAFSLWNVGETIPKGPFPPTYLFCAARWTWLCEQRVVVDDQQSLWEEGVSGEMLQSSRVRLELLPGLDYHPD